ncbi:hypothetical protein BJY24_000570 [Nocardia transvalensis]|uniref:Uncharacterized protein n=1 Tax=Nocardia transvalensis TaxID=37333 RepID=A0A7W9UFY3_9NOCA|nr:hypothetical protein [Nocardia transvalensis]MBB5911703.1 hypothetical protein [Nocardia transvalensis]
MVSTVLLSALFGGVAVADPIELPPPAGEVASGSAVPGSAGLEPSGGGDAEIPLALGPPSPWAGPSLLPESGLAGQLDSGSSSEPPPGLPGLPEVGLLSPPVSETTTPAQMLGLAPGSVETACAGSAVAAGATLLLGSATGAVGSAAGSSLVPGLIGTGSGGSGLGSAALGSVAVGSAATGSALLTCLLLIPANVPPAGELPLGLAPPAAVPASPPAMPPVAPVAAAESPAMPGTEPVSARPVPPGASTAEPSEEHDAWTTAMFATLLVIAALAGSRGRWTGRRSFRL